MTFSPTILIVDDEPINIHLLIGLLGTKYDDILAVTEGEEALALLQEESVDLVMLDITMPGMDGFDVAKWIKQNPKTVSLPIIFITAHTDEASIERAFDAGGVDYITKPFRAKEVLSRVSTHLSLADYQKSLEHKVLDKTHQLHQLYQELEETQREIIQTLGAVSELRSKETNNHVKRVALYSECLARHYGLPEDEIKCLKDASPMHDIGKVAIPDAILNKPGELTDEEFSIMKTHAQLGYEMLKHSHRPLLQTAAIIAHQHHEKWNGQGYPQGLKGEQIHIYGRITAVADVFDALGSDRIYKKAWPDEKIFEFFHQQRGEHFDPTLVDIFFRHLDEFLLIRNHLKDKVPPQTL